MKFLRRYLAGKDPGLKYFAKVVRSLEGRLEGSLPESKTAPQRGRVSRIVAVHALTGGNYRVTRAGSQRPRAHFQPGTRPACSIHSCISGSCACSRVVSLT